MPTPTYTGLDIGLAGGTLSSVGLADSTVRVLIGSVEPARSTFAFPGFGGMFRQTMGPRRQTVEWATVLRAFSLVTLNTIEAAIHNAVKNGGVGALTDSQGNTYQSVILESYVPQQGYDVIRAGARVGWVRKEGRIRFEVLAP